MGYWKDVSEMVKADINRMLKKGYTRRQLKEAGYIAKSKRKAKMKKDKVMFGVNPFKR